MPPSKNFQPRRRECPYCGREFHISNLYSHSRLCPYKPSIKEKILERIKEISEDGRMPSQSDWEFYHDDLPSVGTLIKIFGSWNEFAEWIGYKPNPSGGRPGIPSSCYEPTKTGTVSHVELDESLPGGLSVYNVTEVHRNGRITISYMIR